MSKLDIHNAQKTFNDYYERIDKSSMSPRQKKQIKKFVEEAEIGKNSTKKVGVHRLIANLQSLFKFHEYFKKDLDSVTEKEVVQFYKDLDNDRIKQKNGNVYKKSSKDELIKNLKRFLKTIWDEKKYDKRVRWLKQYEEIPEMEAISMDQIKKLSNGFNLPRDKTLTLFLGDSGLRIEEALNLKISSVEKKVKSNGDEFYVVDVKISKTLPRRISVPIASESLTEWLKIHPAILDKDAYLFPVTYDAYRKSLRVTSKKILGVVVTPHTLRHSSATHYCKILGNNVYKFCYRYGWAINSKMPRRYIDRNQLGEEAQEELDNLVKNNKIAELSEEIEGMKQLMNEREEKIYSEIEKLLKTNKQTITEIKKANELVVVNLK